ncbi:glycosyltransferase family 2 protein [Actinocrinis puniceicyclus]|uniref:Glycosyltransferase family 2 protein n=1 Tax=Actinocrinis puniceicyclus TaxID=977794 RepID=A0A8J7WN30_9ACTN|nr:glycosyltransferase family 2 protein [Actinocrinis puniceicyclus]MBS2965416.1 glycosyltransferase family 2 protein [Actinocrinis puniceicyclus]
MTATAAPAAARPARLRPAAAPGRLLRAAREHWFFTLLFAAGAVGRLLALQAYRPLLSNLDSFWYVGNSGPLLPQGEDPIGYSLVIRGFEDVANLLTLAAFQHLLGLAAGLCVYALLWRRGAPRSLAGLAAAPILLDAYQWQMEEYLLSDAVFLAMITGALALLAWRRRPGAKALAAAGLLLGASVVVRSIGEVAIVPALLFALWACGPRWTLRLRSAALLLAGFLLPVLLYAWDMQSNTGQFTPTSATGAAMLYGRAATVAHCASMPPDLAAICPTGTVAQRLATGPDFYDNNPGSPLAKIANDPDAPNLEHRFGMYVIEHRPAAFASAVGRDFAALFLSPRQDVPGATPISRWQFFTTYPIWADDRTPASLFGSVGEQSASANTGLAQGLLDYQLGGGYTPGYFFGAALLAGLAGSAGLTRRARRSPLRPACFLFTAGALALLLGADLFQFSWRYQLPALTLLPLGGALGLMALLGLDKRPRPPLAAYPDPIDAAAVRDFHDRYGERPDLAPVVIVIAAYNEAEAIGPVLESLPAACRGLRVAALVVVDAATDATAQVALEHGAYTCVADQNRGQGAALRLGYRLAREGGAQYIVTTDADGQYDSAQLPRLLAALLDGEADFVTGSRVLGSHQTRDPVRQLGCRVFAFVVSRLMHTRVTDTSFGFRAMRAEVPASLTLEQPQYQSSELLISVLAAGYRVAEVPMTIRQREAGQTKKGGNLVYGFRYARVVLRTWWRERRRAGQPPSAVAVAGEERLAENTQPSKSTNLITNTNP